MALWNMAVWKQIYGAVADRIKEEDRAFELADARFGEARKWLVEQAGLRSDWLVLDIGFGQGNLSIELASALKNGNVVGVDLLHENITTGVTRWIAKKVGVERRIALVNSDSTKLPVTEGAFDAVVSFLALQNIKNTRGDIGVLATIDETCRALKKDGVIAIADNSFPSCRPEGDQGKLFQAIKRYWDSLLPSAKVLIQRMKRNGISEVKALSYDPKESLLPKDAERELRLSVEWAKALGVEVDFEGFWKEVGGIVRKEGRIYSRVVLLLGTGAKPKRT
jgi:ubiquinone/menaquinone biosynthesis C-methylase UbiE